MNDTDPSQDPGRDDAGGADDDSDRASAPDRGPERGPRDGAADSPSAAPPAASTSGAAAARYERYESSRLTAPARKAVLVALVVVVIAAGIGMAFWYYETLGGTDLKAQAVRYDTVDASTATADISLTRDDPHEPAVCVIRSRDTDGAEVGRREVYFPPSPYDDTVISTTIATSGRSGVIEVYGCSYNIPAYLDTRAG